MTIVVAVAQSVRAPGCGPGGRGFESHQPPQYFSNHFVMNIWNIGFPLYEIIVFAKSSEFEVLVSTR